MGRVPERVADTWQCPHGCGWLEQPRTRQQTWRNAHNASHQQEQERERTPRTETVKRASLWDGVLDTYATETELNGFRPSQGAFL